MIERFNFYDLYGYLLPGLTLLGMLWLPLWWLAAQDLPGAWWSAAVALVIAYLLGHIVARLGQNGFPYDKTRGRQPSDGLLDAGDDRLPDTMKTQIVQDVERRFRLQVNVADPNQRRRTLQTAFFLCRRTLLREDAASYAEQFEGLYSMLRGLAAVSTLASSYYLGWAATELLVTSEFVAAAEYAAPAALVVLILWPERPWLHSLLTALLFPVGLYLGATLVPSALSRGASLLLLLLALASVYLAVRFYLGYRYFAEQFAVTVYRDFFVLERMLPAGNAVGPAAPGPHAGRAQPAGGPAVAA